MPEKKDRGDPRKLTITEVGEIVASGEGKNGHWELRKVKALKADGSPITEDLKTFADLTPVIGKLDEFYVERDERQSKDGSRTFVSFLVTPKTSGLQLKVDALTARVEHLERRLDELGAGGQPANPQTAVPQSTPAPVASPATSEDDIPF